MSYKLTNEKSLFDSNGTFIVWACIAIQTVRIVGLAKLYSYAYQAKSVIAMHCYHENNNSCSQVLSEFYVIPNKIVYVPV